MSTIYKLAYVLCHIDDFKWSDALFLPQNEVWNLQSSCVVLDPDDMKFAHILQKINLYIH